MNIQRWWAIVAVSLFLPLAYAGGPEYPKSNEAFSTVDAAGYFTVVLKKGRRAKVTVSHYPSEVVHVQISHHTLYIRSPWFPPAKKRPIVTVVAPNLTDLIVRGPSNVRGDHFNSRGLSIVSLGSGSIQLTGKMKVTHIQQRGDNHIRLRWVDSSTLSLDSRGQGDIYLAGVAKTLYARLAGGAVLQAQYLRVSHVHVQTQNHSSAYVLPLVTLRAFASGRANVYYYHSPRNLTLDAKQSGNVLQMAWRD